MSQLATRVGALLPQLCDLAEEAGRAILQYYHKDVVVIEKADKSPVTAADLASDAIVLAGLRCLTPEIAVITEETFDGTFAVPSGAPFWLVDPLDGTKEFIAQSGEFTVNIGLVEQGVPIIGIIHAPVGGQTWWGGVGQGAWMRDKEGFRAIRVRTIPPEGLTVVGSRYHGSPAKMDTYLADHKVASREMLGSTLKFCAVASGKADLYPHFGTGTREWDTAAGQAIVTAAGGSLQLVEGGEMAYGKPGLRNPAYVVRGG